ncbi:MAG: TlpA family protein disulfide reductase [Chlorobi bacterium CHB2]|nr:TlpA family protein disulfide reductase [Chlorobi bacterium CHB2]
MEIWQPMNDSNGGHRCNYSLMSGFFSSPLFTISTSPMIALRNLNRMLLALALGVAFAACADNAVTTDPIIAVRPELGKPAPDFTLKDQNGATVKLSQFKGKVVVLDFWATWCAPCIASIPEFKDLWSKYRSDDFVLFSISADFGEKEWKEYIAAENMDWVHGFDPGESTGPLSVYAIEYIPDTWIIDKNGIAIAHGLRHNDLDAAVEKALR